MEQDQSKQLKADPHNHQNHLPKDVLNKTQDPESFRDPLEMQKEKEEQMRKVSGPNDDSEPSLRPKE